MPDREDLASWRTRLATQFPKYRRTKPRGGGGKLARSETVTVRLDPKLRYLAELAARKQRRTLSSFIEWAIEEKLKDVYLGHEASEIRRSLAEDAPDLWDVDESDRFVKLVFHYPEMLTHGEQVLWKLIRENGCLWKGTYSKPNGKWTWSTSEDNLVFERLRQYWEIFKAVAQGESGKDTLPTWSEHGPPKRDPDDIPSEEATRG